MKNEYNKDDAGIPSVDEGLKLAVKCLNKTMDSSGNGPEKYELFVMKEDSESASGGEAERALERSDSKCIVQPSYITNNLPLVASLIAVSHKTLTKEEVKTILDSVEAESAAAADA